MPKQFDKLCVFIYANINWLVTIHKVKVHQVRVKYAYETHENQESFEIQSLLREGNRIQLNLGSHMKSSLTTFPPAKNYKYAPP